MSREILTFQEAVTASATISTKRHILLGNGFSIAYNRDSFSYGRLLDEADFSRMNVDMKQVFQQCGTVDFEVIIDLLQNSAYLVNAYGTIDCNLSSKIEKDSTLLKDALADVLAKRHPDHVGMLSEQQYYSARCFLTHFERVYSVNYDLLLYWATMQDNQPPVPRNDGFGESPGGSDVKWVTWNPMMTFATQKIFYLHGALHLFDAGAELRKLTWKRTGISLMSQIRSALDENMYPLVVTEGTSREKYRKILHSAYLNHALRSFAKIGGCLFIYGLSLAPNDEHIVRQIEDGSIQALFVGVYGDINSEENRKIVHRAELIGEARRDRKKPITIQYYNSSTANV